MWQRREVRGDTDDSHDGREDPDHSQRQVPLLAEDHRQLHAKLHARERGEKELLCLRDRQALEQRVDSGLRPHRAHGASDSAGRDSDQARDRGLRGNKLI
jgi:hypothetical protein